MIEFREWPKIARLFRDCVITEKIDGTNAAIGIQEFPFGWHVGGIDDEGNDHNKPDGASLLFSDWDRDDGGMPNHEYLLYTQSRKRLITPQSDNHGFAFWAWRNAYALVQILGPGLHFGEWWGSGIQRGYGLTKGEHRFSLFNTHRWDRQAMNNTALPNVPELDVVPVIYSGLFDTANVNECKRILRESGSLAAPGFMNPEGVVVFHSASGTMFKSTLGNDEVPKEVAKRNLRLAA